LLVSCSATAVDGVLAIFQGYGFSAAGVIGLIEASTTPSFRLGVG
jgi:hypothetical protein